MLDKIVKFVKFVLILLILGCFLYVSDLEIFHGRSCAVMSARADSADAIAIRVIPNPNHYSALSWYKKQGFTGSPQSLTVDGYEAVRDGRTVYVNATNINLDDLYTNIYLISYNQKAELATVDIFSEILSHWKFNTNITAYGHCRQDNAIICLKDNECPIGDICDSIKARIIRDTNRLSDLTEIKLALDSYNAINQHYPILGAGTYLPNKTLSVWPSWRERFKDELGMTMPVDPMNKLGECLGYNETTCWNEETKSFVTVLPDELPENSLIYFYFTDTNGGNYHICSSFESGLSITGLNVASASCPDVCLDFDGDGYGFPGSALCADSQTDCDDTDPLTGAGTPETVGVNCNNNIDDDCDGLVDCNDPDCVGDPDCDIPAGCNYNCICDPDETCLSCPHDFCCHTPTTHPCSDGVCDESCECEGMGYDCPCPDDCFCGNGTKDCGEDCDNGSQCSDGTDCTGNPPACSALPDTTCTPNRTDSTCSDLCIFIVPTCTDNDGDLYISENTDHTTCGNVCGPGHNQSCLGNNDCDDSFATCGNQCFPGNPEFCDGYDNDCDNPEEIDEGLLADDCGFVCNALGFNYDDINRAGDLRCCGDDAGEGNPNNNTYQACEDQPDNFCSDSIDNDCDGDFDDNISNPTNPDTDCLPCGVGTAVDESFWYWLGEPDCNQCNLEGSQDDDQWLEDWSPFPGMADQCDSDCGTVVVTVHVDKYEPTESKCGDGIDNDCDGDFDCNDTDDCGCALPAVCNITTGVCEAICTDNDGDFYIDENTAIGLCGNVCGLSNNAVCAGNDDCDDSKFWVNPGATETCDTLDNNCSGDIDEGCDDDVDGYCDDAMQLYNNSSMCSNTIFTGNGMWGNDCDDDETDDPAPCTASVDVCDEAHAACAECIYPGVIEYCDNIENDCNITTADGSGEIPPFNSKQANICAGSVKSCNGGVWVDDYTGVPGYEDQESTCADGVDNDCDGDIDCDDHPDCDIACGGGNACTFSFTFPCIFP